MRYELFIALRYIRSKKKQTILSLGAIAIAVMIMVVVLAMIAGLSDELHDTTVDQLSHVTVTPHDRNEYIYFYNTLVNDIENMEYVVSASPRLDGSVSLTKADRNRNAQLRGIDAERENLVFSINEDIKEGSFENLILQRNTIVIGVDLAKRLDLEVGDSVDASFPEARPMSLRVVGIFETGTPADENVVYTSLPTSQYFYQTQDVVNRISIRLDDVYKDLEVANAIKDKGFEAAGWTELNPEILQLLNIAYIANTIETGLVAIIASFGVVSTLNTMVMSKVKEIGILMAMGVPKSSIKKIFVIQSGILGLAGSIIGALLGIVIGLSIGSLEYHETDAILGVTELPIVIRALDVFLIILAISVLNLIAGIYPAQRAASLDPVEAISASR